MKVLVTGATGFVGAALVPALRAAGHDVRAAGRAETGPLGPDTDWSALLADREAVVHLAGRAHVMRETAGDPEAEYARVNTDATVALGRQAARAGVRRFVYLSSIKAMGEGGDAPFRPDDPCLPEDAYGRSKLKAEQGLRRFGQDFELIVLRPPLVYGPGVKGNFRALIRAVDRGLPLPLAGLDNRRSLIALDNLVDCIAWCLGPEARAGTYLPHDAAPVSTPGLVRAIAASRGRKARLFAMPGGLLTGMAYLAGRPQAVDRLSENLVLDGNPPGWSPKVDLADQLTRIE